MARARLPTEDEIRERAIELYFMEHPEATTTPEDSELKEGSYWERARIELMYSEATKAMQELERASAEELSYYYDLINQFMNELEDIKERYEELSKKPPVKELSKEHYLGKFIELLARKAPRIDVKKATENFEEEWRALKGLSEEEIEKALEMLAEEKRAELEKPPRVVRKPPEKVKAEREEFLRRWFELLD